MVQYYYKQSSNPNNMFHLSTKIPNYPTLITGGSDFSNSGYIEPPKKRTMLNRVLSPLNVGQYAIAGFVKGLQQDDLNPIVGALQGVYASNPFGQGNAKWEHSFSDVLDNTDWQPQSFIGKGAKFTTGMALDIFLDPLTYVSGGLSGVMKGSGKHSVEIVTKGSKYVMNADDVAKGLGLSFETATDIVKSSELFKSGKFVGDVAEEATELVRKYNKLIGVNQKSAEVTLSLANAPFGKKIFGAAADKSKTLFTSEQVMAFGDKTIAPHFAVARDTLMGSKIGKLFGSDHLIYKLSKDNPSEVFNYFKHKDIIDGMNLANAERITKINELGEKLFNLTPAQNKQLIEIMEDPSTRHKVSKMVQFSETKEGVEYLDTIKNHIAKAELEIDDLSSVFDSTDDLFNLKKINDKQLKVAQQTLAEELSDINLRYVDDLNIHEKYQKTARSVGDKISNIDMRKNKADEIINTFDDYIEKATQHSIDIEAKKKLMPLFDNKAETYYVVQDMKPVPRTRTTYQEITDIIGKPDTVSNKAHNNYLKKLEEFGHIRYDKARGEEWSNLFMDRYGKFGFQRYKDADGHFFIIHPEVTVGQDVAKKVSVLGMYDDLPNFNKPKVIDDISEYVFGQKGMIHSGIFDDDVKKLVDMIKKDSSPEEIARDILYNKDIYSGKAQKVDQFIAKELGVYGRGTNFESFYDYYTVRKEAFDKQIANGKPLSKQQQIQLTEMERIRLKRENIRSSFIGWTNKEVDEMITEEANKKLTNMFRDFIENDTVKRTGDARQDWLAYRNGKSYSMGTEEMATFQTSIRNFLESKKSKSNKVSPIFNTTDDWLDGLTLAEKKVYDGYLNVANDLLNDNKKKTLTEILDYSDDGFKEFLEQVIEKASSISRKEANKAHGELFTKTGKKSKVDVVSDLVKNIDEERRIIKNLDDVKSYDDMYDHFFAKNNDLLEEGYGIVTKSSENLVVKDFTNTKYSPELGTKTKEELSKTIEEIENIRLERITEANDKFRENFNKIKELNEDLDKQLKHIMETNQPTLDRINKLSDDIVRYNKIIDSNDSFETYMRSSEGIGDEAVSSILERVNKHVGEYILDPNGNYDDTVREVATELTKEFRRIGVEEVEIGKLREGQLEGMLNRYLPHILTPEGKAYVDSTKKIAKDGDKVKDIYNFGAEYGFGRKFNQHGISRTIDKIVLNGETIYNPSITQINEYFEPLLKGNKLFNESVAELYLARAFTNNKLMYDNEYMENMVSLLGKEWNGVAEEGYKGVMNYGKLRQFSSNYAKHSSNLDKSDMLSNYLSDDYTKASINLEIGKRMNSPKYATVSTDEISNGVYREFVDKYVKETFTPELSRELYQSRLEELLGKTNTKEILEELQLPLSTLDGKQFDIMNSMNAELKERFTQNIKKSFNSLTGSNVKDITLDKMSEVLGSALRSGDVPEYKIDRFEHLLDKISKLNDIPDAQMGLMQESIIEKTNRARELQIIKDNNKFLQLYDKITHFMKLNQTTVLPGFHVKNKQGNTFRSWLGAGEDILNIDMQKGAIKSINSKGEFAEEAFKVGDEVFTWDKLYKKADELGVMDVQGFAREVGAFDSGKGLLNKVGVPGKFDPTNTGEFFWYRAGTKVGNWTESQDRLLHFAARVKQGMGFKEASEMSQKFLFDYSDLTFFEQNVMKRIFPYYTWLRKNTPLQVEMLLDHPDKFRNVSKVLGGIENMTAENERIDKRWVNDFARDWIQLPFKVTNPEGRKEPVMLNPNLPIDSFNDIPDISDIGGTFRNYGNKVNPIIKIPTELISNKHTFFDAPIVNKAAPFTEKAGTRINHVMSQFSAYPVAKGFATKRGADLGLHSVNALSGIKAVSYDYDKFKAMKRSELKKKRQNSNTNSNDYLNSINRRLGGY